MTHCFLFCIAFVSPIARTRKLQGKKNVFFFVFDVIVWGCSRRTFFWRKNGHLSIFQIWDDFLEPDLQMSAAGIRNFFDGSKKCQVTRGRTGIKRIVPSAQRGPWCAFWSS